VSRTIKLAEQIRQEVSDILAREVRDPGIGFLTLTRVTVAPDVGTHGTRRGRATY